MHEKYDSEAEHESHTSASNTGEKTNLIVNYLPPDFDDFNLKSFFEEFGEIVISRVVKDRNTKKSLGYGFVKFARNEDALGAIEMRNGYIIGEKKIKVSFARPSTEDIRNCKLYVTNLPKDFGQQEVTKLFSQFGEIIECRVLQDRNTKSNRGVAFVQFSSRSEANNALSLNGFQASENERGLVVKFAEDQQKKKTESRGLGFGMAYDSMGMGSHSKTQGDYEEDPYYYGSVGRMPSGSGSYPGYYYANDVPRRNYYGKNSPPQSHPGSLDSWYPSVSHLQHGPYDRAPPVNAYGQTYDPMPHTSATPDRVLKSMLPPSPDMGHAGSVTLLISNLPAHADVATLHDLISPYGRILSANIDIVDQQGSPTNARAGLCSGRAQVQMASISQAQYAIQALHGTIMFEGGLPLQINLSYGRVTNTGYLAASYGGGVAGGGGMDNNKMY